MKRQSFVAFLNIPACIQIESRKQFALPHSQMVTSRPRILQCYLSPSSYPYWKVPDGIEYFFFFFNYFRLHHLWIVLFVYWHLIQSLLTGVNMYPFSIVWVLPNYLNWDIITLFFFNSYTNFFLISVWRNFSLDANLAYLLYPALHVG